MVRSTRPLLRRVPRTSAHPSTDDARQDLRLLLRETAQPVVVATALVPSEHPSVYHGATLSSFTSIALDPLPLIAFSLRIPSRMASALNSRVAPSPSPSAHLIINILSAAQPHLAERFARSDLYPCPFQDPHVNYTLSQDGLPILAGALGALSCRLVRPSLSLARLFDSHAFDDDGDEQKYMQEDEMQPVSGQTGLPSELFIARVLRVERVPSSEDEQDRTELHNLPLLYHQQRYMTVGNYTKP